ncbi:GntR family transcriptional regulator [Scopulibacillus darangshiensis]|uniref:GntR family transcriptional regulator n=1 Tax=Scopulibacillus darangshiensis TaxID=442528 RepID=A0A4R2P445_9BACL|nr:GntR family transcriptional regulator [Scopulibacillus darangshiensis]TCP29579.1 GntR family transcriptional regulator [Scopulibacillus darangshiensis]
MKLDFESAEPLHIQLKNYLKREIMGGIYKHKIPSERELMDRYSVSRTTVRAAISDLVHEGILEKRHGKGTFVSNVPVHDWLGSFTSFTETIKNMKMQPGTRLLFNGIESSSKKIKNILETEKYYMIERLRFADDIPIAIEKHYYPLEIGKELEKYDLNSAVLYDLLESALGVNLWKADQMITAGKPEIQDAEHLMISKDSSVLMSDRIITTPKGDTVEFLKSVFRSDMYAFNIEMKRRKG